ncbi:hypothetical protein [Aliarcobacter butzleri]|uniref:hypothetical protein n=1 Tax=Aliarcobacter butzleri TaxID=28197 RepID=UPI001269DB23|nr:hypothetical protein [Aliarcobacter butzleri]
MSMDKGVFSNVEKNRRDKFEIKRRDKYIYMGLSLVFIGLLSLILSRNGTFSKDFFLINIMSLTSWEKIQKIDFAVEYYLGFLVYIILFWGALIRKEPLFKKGGLIRKIGYLFFLPLNLLHKGYLKILCKIDKKRKPNPDDSLLNDFFKLIYLPFNFLYFTADETKAFKFTPLWYRKLEKDFFRQTHNKVDGITRVKDLVALKEFHLLYTAKEYEKLIRLFKSENSFIDYLKITEGYLTEEGKPKYDVLYSSRKISSLKNFRAYNGKDKVYFSMDYILYKVGEQSKIFKEFLDTRFLKGTTRVNVEILTFFKYTVNDKNFEYNLLGVTEKDLNSNKYTAEEKNKLRAEYQIIKSAKEKNDITTIENLLKERLVIMFKFFLARVILQRYCNIPSGLLVVKLEDYTMRMIAESYSDKKLINIAKSQNDGSSNSFKGDGLVNLFLYTWNAFLYGRKTRLMQEIEFNINTISDTSNMYDKDVNAIVTNMEKEIEEYGKSF